MGLNSVIFGFILRETENQSGNFFQHPFPSNTSGLNSESSPSIQLAARLLAFENSILSLAFDSQTLSGLKHKHTKGH